MSEREKFDSYIKMIDDKIKFYLDKNFVMYDEMFYCINSGGKRLRPLLVLATCEDKNKLEEAIEFACGIEFIHNYSLVHDDLPALDNDNYRRKKLTCHKKFGEANAVLTGDALLNFACEIILDACVRNNRNLLAAKKIFNAAGINGMIKGQYLDLNLVDKKNVDKNILDEINLNKTGALIRVSLEVGVMIENDKDDKKIDFFRDLGNKLGLAFQIRDDMFDREKVDELNYFNILGEKKALERLNDLTQEIYDKLNKLSGYSFLKYLIKVILERKN